MSHPAIPFCLVDFHGCSQSSGPKGMPDQPFPVHDEKSFSKLSEGFAIDGKAESGGLRNLDHALIMIEGSFQETVSCFHGPSGGLKGYSTSISVAYPLAAISCRLMANPIPFVHVWGV